MARSHAKVGVIGAGVMGRGLSEALACANYEVVLVDIDDAILEKARSDVARALKMAGMFDAKARAADTAAILERIVTTTDYSQLVDVDFVIENTTEDWSIKEEVYQNLDRHCPKGCILAANTSAISISKIATLVSRPERLVGMHFMNPAPKKPVVEVIRGQATSELTVNAACALLNGMGKRAILVGDSPGFVTNRVLMLTINEAIAVVHEGIATPVDVDSIFVGCFAHAMGPLATADLIGLDTVLKSLNVLQDDFKDPKYEPSLLLRQMVTAGNLGRKSGLGFFDYEVRRHVDGRSK
jgi:3-hydroxybutyryl-CoA dehydrogenase